MKKLTHRLFGGPWGLGALGPGPPGPLDKTALDRTLHLQFNRMSLLSFWIAYMCSGVSTTVQQAVNVLFIAPCAKQHLLQSLRWKPNTDQDWTLKMTYGCHCTGKIHMPKLVLVINYLLPHMTKASSHLSAATEKCAKGPSAAVDWG